MGCATKMIITLDIETCPAQDPAIRAGFLANVTAPAQYKKPESIAEWIRENGAAEAESAWRKTSFDGSCGHICVIGVAIDDFEPVSIYRDNWHASERDVLREFFDLVDATCAEHPSVQPVFVGHNLIDFDLRFIFHRAVVLGVKPSNHINFNARPIGDRAVFDTMTAWAGFKNRISLDKLSKALGAGGKGDIDGSKVWDYVREGRIAEVAEYCKHDVEITRAVYKRMTFADMEIA